MKKILTAVVAILGTVFTIGDLNTSSSEPKKTTPATVQVQEQVQEPTEQAQEPTDQDDQTEGEPRENGWKEGLKPGDPTEESRWTRNY